MKNEKTIVIISLIFFVILYTVFKIFFISSLSVSFVIGWIVSFFNFIGVVFKVRKSFNTGNFGAFVLNSQFRLFLTGLFLYFCFKRVEINLVGLLVGLTSTPVCIPISFFIDSRRKEDGASA
jgi:hypothetical protein